MTDADLNNDSWQDPQGDANLTASQMLVRAREARGLSQSEVADKLFLSEKFIRYIDDGDFQKLPKAAFVKGYLRSYARAVSLDGAVVVSAYERDQNIASQLPEIGQVSEDTVGPGTFTGPVVQTGMIGLGLILIVVSLVWWLAGGSNKQPPAVAEDDTSVLSETPSARLPQRVEPAQGNRTNGGSAAPQSTVESAPIAPDSGGPASASAGGTDNTAVAGTGGTSTKSAATAHSEQTPKVAGVQIDRKKDGDKQLITVTAGGTDKMEFSFTGECWVEITDGRGEKIYSDLNRAGDVMTVSGVAPFEVLLGKAPVASMTWQGEPVDLAQYTAKDQTAKIRTARL